MRAWYQLLCLVLSLQLSEDGYSYFAEVGFAGVHRQESISAYCSLRIIFQVWRFANFYITDEK